MDTLIVTVIAAIASSLLAIAWWRKFRRLFQSKPPETDAIECETGGCDGCGVSGCEKQNQPTAGRREAR